MQIKRIIEYSIQYICCMICRNRCVNVHDAKVLYEVMLMLSAAVPTLTNKLDLLMP